MTAACVIAGVSALLAPAAHAGQTTATHASAGSTTFRVPLGVTSLSVEAVGAEGRPGFGAVTNTAGGRGGFYNGPITVTPGEALTVAVDVGGGTGGKWLFDGGDGGGYSGILRSTTPLLIAPGGGGGAGVVGVATDGGNAGVAAADANGGLGVLSGGGKAGTLSTGGAGGTATGHTGNLGTAGSSLQGGNGGAASGLTIAGGGGGGAGFFGGGGGATGRTVTTPAAGGGGGAFFFVGPHASATSGLAAAGAAPSVKLTYTESQAPSVSLDAVADNDEALTGTASTGGGDNSRVSVEFYPGTSVGSSPDYSVTATVNQATGRFSATAPWQLTDGRWTARAVQRDAASNTGTSTARTYEIDRFAPVTQLDKWPSAISSNEIEEVEFSSRDGSGSGVVNVECSVNRGTWEECSSPVSVEATSADMRLEIRATDRFGNVENPPVLAEWVTDTIAPVVSAITGVPALTTSRSASASFTASDVGSGLELTECQLNAGAWQVCTSPFQASGLADGEHTLKVRATDRGGLRSTPPQSFTWRVDTTAPTTSSSTTVPQFVNSTSVTLAFAGADAGGSGVDRFECRVGNGSWSTCASPHTFTGLAEGSRSLHVRSVDKAGNPDAAGISRSTVVDTTNPATTLLTKPGLLSTLTSAAFTLLATDVGGSGVDRIERRSGNGEWVATTSSPTLTGLLDGEQTAAFRSVDKAGNVETTVASHSWLVDTGAPTTAVSTVVPRYLQATTAQLSFTGADAGSGVDRFECRASTSAAWVTCTSPHTFSSLAQGDHVLQVRAVDKTGHVDATPWSHALTVDTIKPTVTLDERPAALITATTAALTFTAADAGGTGVARVDYRLNDGEWATTTSPLQLSGLGDREHQVELRSVDVAGNTSAVVSHTWRVDTSAPSTVVFTQFEQFSRTASAQVTFTGSDPGSGIDHFECRAAASAAWVTCTSPHTFSSLAQGEHSLQVRAVDKAGHADASPWSHALTIDTIDPVTTLGDRPLALTNSRSAALTFTAADGGTGVDRIEYRLDGEAWAETTSPLELSGLEDGDHEVELRAVDVAGNVESPAISHSWEVDATAPTVTLDAVPATHAPARPSITGSRSMASGDQAHVQLMISGAELEDPQVIAATVNGARFSAAPSAPLAVGTYTARVRQLDAAGNESVATREFSVTKAPEPKVEEPKREEPKQDEPPAASAPLSDPLPGAGAAPAPAGKATVVINVASAKAERKGKTTKLRVRGTVSGAAAGTITLTTKGNSRTSTTQLGPGGSWSLVLPLKGKAGRPGQRAQMIITVLESDTHLAAVNERKVRVRGR